MTFWYSAVLLISTLLMGALAFDELHERHGEAIKQSEGMEEVLNLSLWLGLPSLILSIAGGWWLMRKALEPVATLTEAARNVNERNLNQELPRTHNGDELDQLASVLNDMAARLHDSFTRVREFTLHASHELKTPITVLCGETETELRNEPLGAAARERALSRLDELHRLARIVDGLTLLARADAGLVPLALKPVQFDELVRDCSEDARILAENRGISVTLSNGEPCTVSGDAHRLRQLLLNLADNAVKYNKPGGTINMSLKREARTALLSISNTGPGISREALPRVFDRFFRGDPAHTNGDEGCGLGLSIAQWIVSVHKGSIHIESVPGQHTMVKVALPLLEQQAA
ncbi:MAG TPA: ATP-binding protein [Verrucomicrobiae bacterium]|nr:ATP-binding protein [Verrucomicrobiae bacterium]